jgi:hypothetical protein
MVYSTAKPKPLKIESWDKVYFTLFQIRTADHEKMGSSRRQKNIRQFFLQLPLFKKMDSHSKTKHMLKMQCDRTFYVNLKSKPSLIEFSEAQHSRAELIGLK